MAKPTRQQQVALMKDKLMTQLGQSGVVLLRGVVSQEEYNKDLSGKKGLKVFNEMRRSDGTVRAALLVLKLPILAAGAHIEADSDDPRDQLAAQLTEECLFERISFDDTIRQALTLLDFGFSLFEQTYTVDTFEGREYILLSDLGYRKQISIERWETEDKQPGVTQTLPGGGGKVSIDEIKLTRFTYDQEGDNYEGTSVLRAAYKHWYMKDTLYQVDAIKHEKQGLGILKIKTPSTAKEDDKATAREIAREQRANEEAYIEELEGFSFDFMDMKAKTTTDIMPSVQHHDRQILKSVLAQFLDIGSSDSSGSYAASNDQADIFIMALESVAKLIADRINQTVIPNILELNGLGDRPTPKLAFDRIGRESIQVFSEALNKLFTSGAITPDPEVEQYIRDFLHLPPMSDDMVKRYDEIRAVRKNPALPSTQQTLPPNVEDEPIEASELLTAAKAMREKLKGYAGDANK